MEVTAVDHMAFMRSCFFIPSSRKETDAAFWLDKAQGLWFVVDHEMFFFCFFFKLAHNYSSTESSVALRHAFYRLQFIEFIDPVVTWHVSSHFGLRWQPYTFMPWRLLNKRWAYCEMFMVDNKYQMGYFEDRRLNGKRLSDLCQLC